MRAGHGPPGDGMNGESVASAVPPSVRSNTPHFHASWVAFNRLDVIAHVRYRFQSSRNASSIDPSVRSPGRAHLSAARAAGQAVAIHSPVESRRPS